jgi:hypothetical protein
MECQLRPLVYSLDLNNSPRVKNLWRNKQGGSRCKMAGGGIQSFAKFRAQMCTAECQGLKTVAQFVAFRGKFKSGTVQLWHSAVKFYQGVGITQYIGEWWLAFRSPFESGLPRCYSCCGNPRSNDRGTWQMTKFQHPPFYIESPPVWSVISFCRATFRV